MDHIYLQSLLGRKLGFQLGRREPSRELPLRRSLREQPKNKLRSLASYFARLKVAGVPIEKHLLMNPYAGDPTLLVWTRDAYLCFRDRRFTEIEAVAKRVVNAGPT
jgi:hypothetical protein